MIIRRDHVKALSVERRSVVYTQLECENRLRVAYPEIYRVAMRNSWWHPVSTLRIWVSFEESGYGYHLQGIEPFALSWKP